jgi:hypothetical protein
MLKVRSKIIYFNKKKFRLISCKTLIKFIEMELDFSIVVAMNILNKSEH